MGKAGSGGIESWGCERKDGTMVRGGWCVALQGLLLPNTNKPLAHVQVSGVRPFTLC